MSADYLATADVWTVLDLIAAEFQSDPMSVQCFDLRLVKRAIELARAGRPAAADVSAVADRIIQSVAELPDRTSPDAWPEAMLVTADELRKIVEAALSKASSR